MKYALAASLLVLIAVGFGLFGAFGMNGLSAEAMLASGVVETPLAADDGTTSSSVASDAEVQSAADAVALTSYAEGDVPSVEVVVGEDGTERASHQVIVSLACDDAREAVACVQSAGVSCVAAEGIASGLFDGEQQFVVTYAGDESAESIGARLKEAGVVSVAEPNYASTLSDEGQGALDASFEELAASALSTTSVNDPNASSEWQLGAANLYDAWDGAKANGAVTVAVIDSGVDTDHPDLVDNLILDYAKNTFSEETGAAAVEDTIGHGTFVSGIIAATANNEVGIAGASYNAKILPVGAVNSSGKLYNSDIIEALSYITSLKKLGAREDLANIRVINLSLGDSSGSFSDTYKAAVDETLEAGILVVAAAGNHSDGVDYPAAYEPVIGVSGLKQVDGALMFDASYSNKGTGVDLSAPGTAVYSTSLNGGYRTWSGTSFATPLVSGVAALLYAVNGDATPALVREVLEDSSVDLGDEGRDDCYGYGAVDAAAAVAEMAATTMTVVTEPTCTEDGVGEYLVGDVRCTVVIPALGHDYQVTEIDPTCTEPGKRTSACARCGDTQTEEIEALGHDFGEWTTVIEPTESTAGLERRVCARCEYEETREISRIKSALEEFVERLYENVLGREADEAGLAKQIEGMKTSGAARIVYNFFNSDEYKAKAAAMSSEEQVELVYRTLLDRDADAEGKSLWVSYLDNGMTACALVAGFAEADEFIALCEAYGVEPGSSDSLRAALDPRDRNPGVTRFAMRLYTTVLGRDRAVDVEGGVDSEGLNAQCKALLDGAACWKIAYNFFNSDEFASKHPGTTSDDREAIVRVAYAALLGRDADEEYVGQWASCLKRSGLISMVRGFCQSDEFEAICQECGMTSGMR